MAKSIRFVRNVISESDYDETPDKAYISLDENLVKRILMLSRKAKKLGVYKITEFDYTPTFRPDTRLEYLCLNVMADGFFWDGCIKHTSVSLETDYITIEDLKAKIALKGQSK